MQQELTAPVICVQAARFATARHRPVAAAPLAPRANPTAHALAQVQGARSVTAKRLRRLVPLALAVRAGLAQVRNPDSWNAVCTLKRLDWSSRKPDSWKAGCTLKRLRVETSKGRVLSSQWLRLELSNGCVLSSQRLRRELSKSLLRLQLSKGCVTSVQETRYTIHPGT